MLYLYCLVYLSDAPTNLLPNCSNATCKYSICSFWNQHLWGTKIWDCGAFFKINSIWWRYLLLHIAVVEGNIDFVFLYIQVVVNYTPDSQPNGTVWAGLDFMRPGENWTFDDEDLMHSNIVMIDSNEVCSHVLHLSKTQCTMIVSTMHCRRYGCSVLKLTAPEVLG